MDVYLHIGSGKTGTSSIQALLSRNRERLAAHGCLYPTAPGVQRHIRVSFSSYDDARLVSMPNWRRFDEVTPDEFRRRFADDLRGEVAGSGLRRVVLSDEGMYGLAAPEIARLRGVLETFADAVHVVVYLRRQDDHMISRYQQVVKTGETRTLREYADLDLSDTYDYARRLGLWAQEMRPTTLTVRRFEPSSFEGGSLLRDFLAQVGLVDAADGLDEPPAGLNTSLDAAAVEFLRLWNIKRVRFDGDTPRKVDNARHLRTLSRLSTGPVLTLPEPVIEPWMAQWHETNRSVARTRLGAEDGVLFREPRRMRHVTTEQRLPARAREEILRHLDIPLRGKNRLRAVAEEAAATPVS